MFDLSMFDSLSDLVGGSLSDWSWLKASLPISLGGLGVRRASSHASAAFVGSLDQSRELVSDILGYAPPTSQHLAPTLEDLVSSTGRDNWSSLERVDVRVRQRALSRVIDQASLDHLINRAPNVLAKAWALSSSIPHVSNWLHVVLSAALGLHLHDLEIHLCF